MEPHGADRYAQVPVVTHEGEEALYAIIFTLDKVKGLGGPHLEWFAFVYASREIHFSGNERMSWAKEIPENIVAYFNVLPRILPLLGKLRKQASMA